MDQIRYRPILVLDFGAASGVDDEPWLSGSADQIYDHYAYIVNGWVDQTEDLFKTRVWINLPARRRIPWGRYRLDQVTKLRPEQRAALRRLTKTHIGRVSWGVYLGSWRWYTMRAIRRHLRYWIQEMRCTEIVIDGSSRNPKRFIDVREWLRKLQDTGDWDQVVLRMEALPVLSNGRGVDRTWETNPPLMSDVASFALLDNFIDRLDPDGRWIFPKPADVVVGLRGWVAMQRYDFTFDFERGADALAQYSIRGKTPNPWTAVPFPKLDRQARLRTWFTLRHRTRHPSPHHS